MVRGVWGFDSASPHPSGTSRSLLSNSASLRFAKEGELTLTVGTGEGFGSWKFESDFGGLAEESAQDVAVLFGSSGGEAVVAHSHEAFW